MFNELLQMLYELLMHIFLCSYGLLSWDPLRWISFFIAWLHETTDHRSFKQPCQDTHLRDWPCAFPTGIGPSCWWMWRACQKKKKSWSHEILNLQVLHKQFLGYSQFLSMRTQHKGWVPGWLTLFSIIKCLLAKESMGGASCLDSHYHYLCYILSAHGCRIVQVFSWVSAHGWKKGWSCVLFPPESKKNLWLCKCAMADPTSSSILR